MLDPFGVYTLQESLWVGHELEKLDYYWLEHPMVETKLEPYRRLTRELDIAICSPEHVPGGHLYPRRVDAAGRLGYVPHRRGLWRDHRVLQDGHVLPGPGHPVRDARRRLDQQPHPGGHARIDLRVL